MSHDLATRALCYDVAVQWRDGAGAINTSYYSTIPRAGMPGDATYAGFIDGRVRQLGLQESVWAPGGTRGARQIWNGAVELENSDGGLDVWSTRNAHMCQIVVRQINLDNPAVAVGEFKGVVELVEVTSGSVILHMRDQSFVLNRPALTQRYAGNNVLPNGLEGGPEIKGRGKPMILGRVFNWTPPLVNSSRLIYQLDAYTGLNTGWALTVKSGGHPMAIGPDYASQADMEANAPTFGQFRVWPAGGCFRIGSTLVGAITCDVVNPVVYGALTIAPAPLTGHQGHVLVARILSVGLGGTTSVDATSTTAQPEMGLVVEDDMTYLDAINALTSGYAGWTLNNGALVMHSTKDPATLPSTRTYDEDSIEGSAGKSSLEKIVTADEERGIPVWRVTVKYRRNHAVQRREDLVGSVSEADVAALGQEWRTVTASDAAVLTQYPQAPEITIHSAHYGDAEAQLECDRLLAIYKVRRETYAFTAPVSSSSPEMSLPSVATLRNQRFMLSAGKPVILVGRQLDVGRRTVSLTMWG